MSKRSLKYALKKEKPRRFEGASSSSSSCGLKAHCRVVLTKEDSSLDVDYNFSALRPPVHFQNSVFISAGSCFLFMPDTH